MEELNYRAETCSSPIGETGDYDSWIELITPDFNMQCYDPDVELEQVEELANMLNIANNCNIHDVSQRSELLKAFYAYVDDKWALGMLTDKVDEVIEGFEKSL